MDPVGKGRKTRSILGDWMRAKWKRDGGTEDRKLLPSLGALDLHGGAGRAFMLLSVPLVF